MNLMSRMFNGLFALAALLLTCTTFPTEWLFEQVTVTDQFGNRASLREIQRKSGQLSREAQVAYERIVAKDEIAEALRNGEMTLLAAATRFRALHADPQSWHNPYRPLPEHQDGAAWCRLVIEWVEANTRIDHSPSQADALRQRLEAELQEQLDCYGTVILPE